MFVPSLCVRSRRLILGIAPQPGSALANGSMVGLGSARDKLRESPSEVHSGRAGGWSGGRAGGWWGWRSAGGHTSLQRSVDWALAAIGRLRGGGVSGVMMPPSLVRPIMAE